MLLGGFCVGRGRGWWVCAAAAPAVVAADAASLSLAEESPSSLVTVNSQWNSCLDTDNLLTVQKSTSYNLDTVVAAKCSLTIGTGSAVGLVVLGGLVVVVVQGVGWRAGFHVFHSLNRLEHWRIHASLHLAVIIRSRHSAIPSDRSLGIAWHEVPVQLQVLVSVVGLAWLVGFWASLVLGNREVGC